MIGGRVLDVSAIVDYATARTVYMAAFVRVAVEQTMGLVLPVTALTQAWQQVPPDGRSGIEDLLGRPVVVVDELDTAMAADVGLLLHATDQVDVVAGQVAWSAARRDWPVVTAEPDRLRALTPDVAVEQIP